MTDVFVIKFYTPVNEASIGTLMKTVDQRLAAGAKEFTVLISTSGGSVLHGLTACNDLEGIPATVTTHNVGSVDSIGVAGNTKQTRKQVLRAMLGLQSLDPDRALEWGLVHEIRQELFAPGAEVVPIQSGG